MNEVKVCLDSVRYKSKPVGSDIGKISRRIGKNIKTLNSPKSYSEFVHKVAQYGHTFTPATFNNGERTDKNFQQTQLLVLDFDGGISFEEAQKRASQYDLPIFFAYDTFSCDGDNEKFRIVFLNDVPIDDIRAAKILKEALIIIFPEADKHDSQIAKMYFGGKRLRYYDHSHPTVNPEAVLRNMDYYLKNTRGPTHFKKHIKEFAIKHGVRLTERGLLDISFHEIPTEDYGKHGNFVNGNFMPKAILLIKDVGTILPKCYYQINLDCKLPTSSQTA